MYTVTPLAMSYGTHTHDSDAPGAAPHRDFVNLYTNYSTDFVFWSHQMYYGTCVSQYRSSSRCFHIYTHQPASQRQAVKAFSRACSTSAVANTGLCCCRCCCYCCCRCRCFAETAVLSHAPHGGGSPLSVRSTAVCFRCRRTAAAADDEEKRTGSSLLEGVKTPYDPRTRKKKENVRATETHTHAKTCHESVIVSLP